MISSPIGIALVLMTLVALIASLKLIERLLHPPVELTRKLLHVGMGLVVLTFPWLFDKQWPVILLAGIATLTLLSIKFVPRLHHGVGTILAVHRPSLGEVYFPIAVGVLFWMTGFNKLLYCVPLLILALADTTAALIGIAYGRVRFVTSEGLKSAEGSLAFFAIAFLSVHIPLLLFTQIGRTETLLIAAIIGVLSTLIEAASWRGLDNLLIPLGTFAFLKLYLPMGTHELTFRLLATVALLIVALAGRARSSLDDSALLGAALFAYGALMLGGWVWLVGPVLLFIGFALLWPRLQNRREHSVFALLAVTATPLIWLTLHVRDGKPLAFYGYATSIGVQLAMFGVSHIRDDASGRRRQVATWILLGSTLSLVQLAIAASPWRVHPLPFAFGMFVVVPVGVAISGLMLKGLRPLLHPSRTLLYQTELIGALLGSTIAILLLRAFQ